MSDLCKKTPFFQHSQNLWFFPYFRLAHSGVPQWKGGVKIQRILPSMAEATEAGEGTKQACQRAQKKFRATGTYLKNERARRIFRPGASKVAKSLTLVQIWAQKCPICVKKGNFFSTLKISDFFIISGWPSPSLLSSQLVEEMYRISCLQGNLKATMLSYFLSLVSPIGLTLQYLWVGIKQTELTGRT